MMMMMMMMMIIIIIIIIIILRKQLLTKKTCNQPIGHDSDGRVKCQKYLIAQFKKKTEK